MPDDLPEARERVCPCCNGVGAVSVRAYEALVAPERANLDTVLRLVYLQIAEISRAPNRDAGRAAADRLAEMLGALGYPGRDYARDYPSLDDIPDA